MAVMAKEAWMDERLGDLKGQVEKGFDEVKGEVRDLRSDMDRGFARVDADIREVRGEVRECLAETNARFDSMQRTMIIGFAGIVASTVGSVIAAVLVA